MNYYPYPHMYDLGLIKSLELIREAVADEAKDRKFYEYLINEAPNSKEKKIITSIRDDEIKHFRLFKKIYYEITGCYPKPLPEKEEYKKTKNYLDGIEQALFGELGAVEKYRQIYFGLKTLKHRDILFEIITDELKHASKFNYLFTKNV